jgi:hypothetical protein
MTPEQIKAQQDALLEAINASKADIQKTIDDRLSAQKAEFEDRFKAVDSISDTLEKARQAQLESAQRAAQGNQPGWQPKTWDDIPKLVDQRAQEIARAELKRRDDQLTAEQRRTADEEARYEQEIDRSLNQLEQEGYLPKVGNPNDYNDPGVAARRELLGAASHLGTPELATVADTLTQMHRNNMIFDTRTKTYISAENTMAPLPGKFAPVGNSSTSSPSRFTGPTSREIQRMSMDDLVSLADQRGYGPVPTSVLDQPGGF